MANIVLVAQDHAPSSAFKRVLSHLVSNPADGETTISHFLGAALVETDWETIERSITAADAVLIGRSSSPELAEREIESALTAFSQGIPYAFYEDLPDAAVGRCWFDESMMWASQYYVPNVFAADKARKKWPYIDIVISGNPIEEDFAFPATTKDEVCAALGIRSFERLILAPGGKIAAINMQHFGAVIQAASELSSGTKALAVALSLHPGDLTPKGLYLDLVKFAQISVFCISKDQFSTSDLIPGADIVVGSASTVGKEAGYQQKPVIEFFSETALARMEGTLGTRVWQACMLGLAEETHNVPELKEALERLLFDPHGFDKMREKQKLYYRPPKERGRAARIISEKLLSLI